MGKMSGFWRYMGFIVGLPFALFVVFISMALTCFSFTFLCISASLTAQTMAGGRCILAVPAVGPMKKMKNLVKVLGTLHFYFVGWTTCDPFWSSAPVLESDNKALNNQLSYSLPDHVIIMPPPEQSITHTISSRNPSSSQSLSTTDGLSKRCFTYEELVASTNNFSAVNLLGEGGFSYVYKGMLTDGTEVAIKRLKVTHRPTDLEFRKEANILSLVHHRNLVSLIGFCMYKKNWILVCEYVPNKTLEFHLHGTNRPTLAWTDRYVISLETARGLAYLHEDCQPRIIHRDIKAANILLDHSFRAKIADFGIAKNFSDDKTHVSTIVKGTYGYLAPEYASTGQVTDKSDVYSYGVVLLELITGKKPAGLADWARPFLQGTLEDATYDALIDPSLDNNFNPIEMRRLVDCASACLCYSASLRPSMIQIVRALEGYISLGDQTLQVPNRSSINSL